MTIEQIKSIGSSENKPLYGQYKQGPAVRTGRLIIIGRKYVEFLQTSGCVKVSPSAVIRVWR